MSERRESQASEQPGAESSVAEEPRPRRSSGRLGFPTAGHGWGARLRLCCMGSMGPHRGMLLASGRDPPELVGGQTLHFASHLGRIWGPRANGVRGGGVFAVLGMLLAPLLWRSPDSLLGAIATASVGLWLIFATVFVIAFGISLARLWHAATRP